MLCVCVSLVTLVSLSTVTLLSSNRRCRCTGLHDSRPFTPRAKSVGQIPEDQLQISFTRYIRTASKRAARDSSCIILKKTVLILPHFGILFSTFLLFYFFIFLFLRSLSFSRLEKLNRISLIYIHIDIYQVYNIRKVHSVTFGRIVLHDNDTRRSIALIEEWTLSFFLRMCLV